MRAVKSFPPQNQSKLANQMGRNHCGLPPTNTNTTLTLHPWLPPPRWRCPGKSWWLPSRPGSASTLRQTRDLGWRKERGHQIYTFYGHPSASCQLENFHSLTGEIVHNSGMSQLSILNQNIHCSHLVWWFYCTRTPLCNVYSTEMVYPGLLYKHLCNFIINHSVSWSS